MAVEPIAFEVGTASRIGAVILAAGVAVYAAGTAWYAVRAFRAHHEDRWSAVSVTLVVAALAAALATYGPAVLPAPFSGLAVVLYVAGLVFTVTYTWGRFQDHIQRFRREFGARLTELVEQRVPEETREALLRWRDRNRAGLEARRKAAHLAMALFLAVYAALGYLIVRGVWGAAYGGDGTSTGEGVRNLFLASHAEAGLFLVPGHLVSLVALLFVLFLLLPTELLRLRFPELGYPFKDTILERLRDKEAGLFGAHYYITATLPLAVIWLTRDPAAWDTGIPAAMAVIAVTVFADTASALFGIRFGRRKWPHNANKSYVGTAAGTVVAFAVALPFTGAFVAGVTAAAFFIVDVAAPVPVAVSDNILIPTTLAAAYTVFAGDLGPLIPFY